MTTGRSGVLGLLALAGTVLLGSPGALFAQGEAGLPLGTKAPVVAVKDLDGDLVDLGRWIGKKPVLIEFWATWCENCEALLPRMKSAHQAYGDRVEFIGVNVTVNQTVARVRRFAEDHALPFRILYDDQGTSIRAYRAPATSYVVIIDAAGAIVYTGVGPDQPFEPGLARATGVRE